MAKKRYVYLEDTEEIVEVKEYGDMTNWLLNEQMWGWDF